MTKSDNPSHNSARGIVGGCRVGNANGPGRGQTEGASVRRRRVEGGDYSGSFGGRDAAQTVPVRGWGGALSAGR